MVGVLVCVAVGSVPVAVGRRRLERHGVDGGQRVDAAVAERVVRDLAARGTAARLHRADDHIRVRGVLQDGLGLADHTRQLRARRPEQGHDADDVRAGHRGAARGRIGAVAAVARRAHVHAGCRDLGLEQVRRVVGRRAAAAEAGQRVAAVDGAGRERRGVDRGRVGDRRAARAGVAGRDLDEDARRLRVVDDRLELGPRRAAFARGAAPAIDDHVGPHRRVGVLARQVRRRDHELEALAVAGGRAGALVHVAAGHPLRAGGDADLIAAAVGADGAAGGVRAVEVVVARLLRVVAAGVAGAVVDGVPPVVIVVGRGAVPAAILRLERVVRPAHAGVLAGDDDALAGVAQGPDGGRVHVLHAPLDGVRAIGGVLDVGDGVGLDPALRRVRIDVADVGARGQGLDQRPIRSSHDHVRRPVRGELPALRLEVSLERPLGGGGEAAQRVVDVPAARVLVGHGIGGRQVRLLGQHDDDGRLAAVRGRLQHLRGDLRERVGGRRVGGGAGLRRAAGPQGGQDQGDRQCRGGHARRYTDLRVLHKDSFLG